MTSEYSADALFGEGDLGLDKTEANDLLGIRARFDKLPPSGRFSLAEAFIRFPEGDLLGSDVSDFKREQLELAEEKARELAGKCGLCGEAVNSSDPMVERQNVWVTPGSNQVQIREELGEVAHAACVKRVKEGGSAEAPLF